MTRARAGGRQRTIAARAAGGAGRVTVGLVLLGVCTYAFLAVTARAVGPTSFAAISVLYSLVFIVGPGLFLPLEQELARTCAARAARSEGTGPIVQAGARWALELSAAACLVILLCSDLLAREWFDGSGTLVAALATATVGYAAAYAVRGILAAQGRFLAYGSQLAAEGMVRLVGALVLTLAHSHSVGAYSLVFAAAPLASLLLAAPRRHPTLDPGPPAEGGRRRQLGILIVGAILSQTLVNGAPALARTIATAQEAQAVGALLACIVVVRVPLFLFAAVQAVWLPSLAAAVARGDKAAFGSAVRRLTLALTAGTGLATGLASLLGPAVVRAAFGPRLSLGHADLALLALSAGLHAVATATAQALLALDLAGQAAVGWAAALVVAALTVAFLPAGAVVCTELALLAGTVAAAVLMTGFLVRGAARPAWGPA